MSPHKDVVQTYIEGFRRSDHGHRDDSRTRALVS
jgi:hypothetical protein